MLRLARLKTVENRSGERSPAALSRGEDPYNIPSPQLSKPNSGSTLNDKGLSVILFPLGDVDYCQGSLAFDECSSN